MQAKHFGRNDERGPNCAVSYFVSLSKVPPILESDNHAFRDAGLGEVHSLREKAVRDDIARRLSRVCSNFPKEDFEKLIRAMAARQLKCERRQNW
jgi:hypothetical protein